MSISEHLRRARERYASAPSHVASHLNPTPNTYCIVTAISSTRERPLTTGEIGRFERDEAYRAMMRVIGFPFPVEYNATHTTEEVLAKFDEAISYAEAIEAEHDTHIHTQLPETIENV